MCRAAAIAIAAAQDSNTPLHFAAWKGKVECVRVLVQRGANTGALNCVRRAAAPLRRAAPRLKRRGAGRQNAR